MCTILFGLIPATTKSRRRLFAQKIAQALCFYSHPFCTLHIFAFFSSTKWASITNNCGQKVKKHRKCMISHFRICDCDICPQVAVLLVVASVRPILIVVYATSVFECPFAMQSAREQRFVVVMRLRHRVRSQSSNPGKGRNMQAFDHYSSGGTLIFDYSGDR